MNKKERITMIRAMEFIARTINDENIFERWLMLGVADGDIDESTTDEELEYYCDDEIFQDLMSQFTRCMMLAHKTGGLYCDNVCTRGIYDE
jgi:hypothetical protein